MMPQFFSGPMKALNSMVYILLIMYAVQLVNVLTGGALRGYGIYPRNIHGLIGIVCSPFIHGSWWHLFNNTLGFVIFSVLCLTRGSRFYLRASAIIIFVGGLMVWIFGRQAVHVGASGWIFGLWSLSITLAWFERSIVNILISIAVIVFYGGMIWGVLPTSSYTSFEGHAFGALAGVLAAARLGKRQRQLR